MSQKFISLDDAAVKLGLSKERLNALREAGDLRAYRDGSSWKFRTEEIDKLEAEGLPAADQDDMTLNLGDDFDLGLDMGSAAPIDPPPEAAESDPTDLADLDDIGLGVEPLGDGDDAESILLTGDQELEGGIPRPQSTIIGKSELSLEDDLQLSGSDGGGAAAPAEKPTDTPAPGAFDDLDELELDLDESSDQLAAEKPKVAEAAAAAASDLDLEELELDLSGSDLTSNDASSGSDILGGQEPKSGADLSSAGSVAGLSGIDSFNLADDEDDDLVLGGSDDFGPASGGDSGINLSPSDSGFALDEVPLDLGGSAIGSALDLASLSAASAASGVSGLGSASSGLGGDFQLTPDDASEEEEDSSQIVALEDVGEEEDDDMPGFEPIDDGGDAGFGDGLASGIGAGSAPATAVIGAAQEVPFPGWIIGLLSCGFFSMLLAGVMAMDLMQSMWAWDEPYSFTSSLMDGILGIFG